MNHALHNASAISALDDFDDITSEEIEEFEARKAIARKYKACNPDAPIPKDAFEGVKAAKERISDNIRRSLANYHVAMKRNGYCGVTFNWHRAAKSRFYVMFDGKTLASCETAEEANAIYEKLAIAKFGNLAVLNTPEGLEKLKSAHQRHIKMIARRKKS